MKRPVARIESISVGGMVIGVGGFKRVRDPKTKTLIRAKVEGIIPTNTSYAPYLVQMDGRWWGCYEVGRDKGGL